MAGGRPPMFDSIDILSAKIDDYFEYIKGDYADLPGEDGKTERFYDRYPENPSLTALALFLGFESRQSFYDYEKTSEFSYTIKRARLKVEAAYEQALLTRNSTGAIFALKNFGWSDKQEHDITSKGMAIGNAKDLSKLSDEELRTMANIESKLNA